MKNIGQNLSKFLLLPIAILILSTSSAQAITLNSDIKEYGLKSDGFIIDQFTYQNVDGKEQTVEFNVYSYDPKNNAFLTTTPLATVNKTRQTVKKGRFLDVKYAITVPKDISAGTYFNVISVEPVVKKGAVTDVAIKHGVGVLLVINVTESTTTIEKIFQTQIDTQLVVENTGFPYMMPMKISYELKNNSNYVFKPVGEIRVIDNDGQQVTDRYQINEESKTVYPGDTISIKKKINSWNDLKGILKSKKISARIYSGREDNYITNEIEVSIIPQIITVGIFTLCVLIGVVIALISFIKSLTVKKPAKK